MTRKIRAAWAIVVLTVFALAFTNPASAKRKDLIVPLKLPPAAALGVYEGDIRIAVGNVTDGTFCESPTHLGMGPQALYTILADAPRADAIRQGVTDALQLTGLLADSPSSATHTLEVTILRDHYQTHASGGRWRLRSEVFLEFSLERDGEREGWVLAAGTSETYAQVATKKKISQTYQIGFNDAMYKFFNSQTLGRILGEEWKPAAAPSESGKYDTTRIHKDEFYGPTPIARGQVRGATVAMEGKGPYNTVFLPDFTVKELEGKKDEDIDPEFANAYVPELVQEHLNAFFPGAFAEMQRAEGGPDKPGIALKGDMDEFRIGSFNKRIWLGFGAGKDKLEGHISFMDSSTGTEIYHFEVLNSNWGAGWQAKRGHIRDMADQLARDIAYILVKSTMPDYQPPADLEVLFDETPYPMKQRKK